VIDEILRGLYRQSGLAFDYSRYKQVLIAAPLAAASAAAALAYIAMPRLFPTASIALGALAGLLAFAAAMAYPLLLVARRRNSFEANFIYTLSFLHPLLAAGLSLGEALAAAAAVEDDKIIARELKLVLRDISMGKDPLEALEESAARVPSPMYKETARLIANAVRLTQRVDLVLLSRLDWLIRMRQIRASSLARSLTVLFEVYVMAAVLLPLLIAILALSLAPLGAANILGIAVQPLALMTLMAFAYVPATSFAFYGLFSSMRRP
jgi:flagellar protein FlaJ